MEIHFLMFKHYNECWELSRVFGLFLNEKCLPRRWRRDYSLRDPKTDLERIFQKKYAEEHFCKRKSPNQGTYIGTVIAQPPPRCAPLRQNQRASSERAIKQGVQGACPRPSFSPFLGRNGDPRRAGGPPGALRPEAPEKPRPPKGYAVPHHAPARSRAGTHAAGSNLRRSQPAPPTRGSPVRRSPRALDSVNIQGPGAFLRKVGGHFLQGQEISL